MTSVDPIEVRRHGGTAFGGVVMCRRQVLNFDRGGDP